MKNIGLKVVLITNRIIWNSKQTKNKKTSNSKHEQQPTQNEKSGIQGLKITKQTKSKHVASVPLSLLTSLPASHPSPSLSPTYLSERESSEELRRGDASKGHSCRGEPWSLGGLYHIDMEGGTREIGGGYELYLTNQSITIQNPHRDCRSFSRFFRAGVNVDPLGVPDLVGVPDLGVRIGVDMGESPLRWAGVWGDVLTTTGG